MVGKIWNMDMMGKLISVFIVLLTCMNLCAVAESGSGVHALVTNHSRKFFENPESGPFYVTKRTDIGERTLPPDMQYIFVNRSDEELIIEDCLSSYSLCMTFERERENTQVCSVQIETKKTFRSFCEMVYENCKTSNNTWKYFHDGPCEVEFVEERQEPLKPFVKENPPQPPPPGDHEENNPPFVPPKQDNAPPSGGSEGPATPPSPSLHQRYATGTFWF